MTDLNAPMCCRCKHFHHDGSWSCDAYPEGIPKEIVIGVDRRRGIVIDFRPTRIDHHFPYKGDHGIQFEEREE